MEIFYGRNVLAAFLYNQIKRNIRFKKVKIEKWRMRAYACQFDARCYTN